MPQATFTFYDRPTPLVCCKCFEPAWYSAQRLDGKEGIDFCTICEAPTTLIPMPEEVRLKRLSAAMDLIRKYIPEFPRKL